MKKISINLKLFFWFSFLVLSVLFTIWILNSTVLESYYLMFKEKNLIKTYESINKIYSSERGNDSVLLELEKIEANQNMDIIIKDDDKLTIYSTSKDFSNNIFVIPDYALTGIPFDKYFSDKLSGSEKYFTDVIRDNRINSDFVALFGRLNKDYFIFMRTPMESIKESVAVTNRFLLIIGFLSIIVSSILAYIISKSFTKPITELNTIAKNISELDFSKPYIVTSYDEIGMLGRSINTLSKSLETKIQELNEVNIELEKDVEQKSKLAEMRSQFVSDVSHELKTPIALIQGYAEGLIDGIATSEEDRKYYCEVILDEANKMSALTRDLLDLSNLEYGTNNLNIQPFNIVELISNILKKNEIIFNDNEIKTDFISPCDEIIVNGDTFRIEQVITNYINNALKNVDENKKINVIISLTEQVARVSVFNSGKNIEPENILRIWNKFYKVDIARTRDNNGSGIGLSLVKAIMDQHKNNYGVNNTSDGVEFWFELNLNK